MSRAIVRSVADTEEKGKFSTNIGEDVIRAALESVKKHTAPEIVIEDGPEDGSGSPGDPEAVAPVSSKELEELRVQLELSTQKGREMMDRLKETHEKMLRAVADLDNYKKRALKEKEEVQKFGNEKLLKDVLPVLDNMDRALAHANSSDVASLKTGIEMVRKQLEDILGRHGVKGFTSVGKPFDPRFHEAMTQKVTDEVPPAHVVSEEVRGFLLNDRLVRPALVTVSLAPPKPAAPEPAAPASEAVCGPSQDSPDTPSDSEPGSSGSSPSPQKQSSRTH